jgi:hypothetical protein
MAKNKKNKLFSFSFGKRKTKAQVSHRKDAAFLAIKIILAAVLIGAACVGLCYLDKEFVKPQTGVGAKWVKMDLVDAPRWISNDLRRAIYTTAGDNNGWFLLDENTADSVYSKLKSFPWLYNLKVKTDPNSITVSAEYYKPAMLVESGSRKVYIAADRPEDSEQFKIIVLNYIPLYEVAIPLLKGANLGYLPEPGFYWQQEDAEAAVGLANLFKLMDRNMAENAKTKRQSFKPLLDEIGNIDVTNFDGRKNKKESHIIIYAKDETPIHWGTISGGLEAVPAEKLGKLYQCYKDFGTLQLKSKGLLQYIDLRIAEKISPIP